MSSFPGAYNFEVKQPTWADTIVYKIATVAQDLTGYTPTIRVKFATGTVSYSTAAGVTCNASGQVSWSLDISAWPTGPIDYDIKVALGSGAPVWLLAGTVTVVP